MRRRSFFIGLPILLLLLLGAAGGFWYYASGEVAKGIAAWRDDWQRGGGTARFEEPEIGGLPLEITARFAQPLIGLPSGETWQGPAEVTARTWLWSLTTIRFDAPGKHRLTLPQGEIALEAAALEGALAFAKGGPESLTLELRDLRLENAGETLQAEAFALSAAAVTAEEPAVALTLRLAGLPLPETEAPLSLVGARLELLSLEGVLRGRFAPGPSPRVIAAAWRDGGGILDIAALELSWGDFHVTGNGSLTLDEQFRPLGTFSFQTAGLIEVVERMDAAGLLDPDRTPLVKGALRALASGQDSQGRDLVTLPITLQDGLVMLGQIPLARLEPVF